MLDYSYPLFRPPAEANSLIFQITYGCSHNRCSFCSMYKTKKFKVRDLKEIYNEIEEVSKYYPETIKIFLADGDALAAETEYLLNILKYLKKLFPKLRRVSAYGSTQNILNKTIDELKELKENNFTLIYYGIESGDDELLEKIDKGVDSKDIINSLDMAVDAGIKLSATVILGLGGKELSNNHIQNSAKIVNSTKITYLSTLQLGLEDGQKEKFYSKFDSFTHLDDTEVLKEQRELINLLEPKNKVIFRSNHASNALHLAGNLPKDKGRLLSEIDEALKIGEDAYIPHFYRGF